MSIDAELTTWLSTSPLLWLTVTLCVWLASEPNSDRCRPTSPRQSASH